MPLAREMVSHWGRPATGLGRARVAASAPLGYSLHPDPLEHLPFWPRVCLLGSEEGGVPLRGDCSRGTVEVLRGPTAIWGETLTGRGDGRAAWDPSQKTEGWESRGSSVVPPYQTLVLWCDPGRGFPGVSRPRPEMKPQPLGCVCFSAPTSGMLSRVGRWQQGRYIPLSPSWVGWRKSAP